MATEIFNTNMTTITIGCVISLLYFGCSLSVVLPLPFSATYYMLIKINIVLVVFFSKYTLTIFLITKSKSS